MPAETKLFRVPKHASIYASLLSKTSEALAKPNSSNGLMASTTELPRNLPRYMFALVVADPYRYLKRKKHTSHCNKRGKVSELLSHDMARILSTTRCEGLYTHAVVTFRVLYSRSWKDPSRR